MTAPVYLNDLAMICALGNEPRTVWQRLIQKDTSGMSLVDGLVPGRSFYAARIDSDGIPVPTAFASQDSRNNRLALLAVSKISSSLEGARARYGPSRIGVVVGTTTSGVAESLHAVLHRVENVAPQRFHYHQQEMSSPSMFLATHLCLEGPAFTVSTACSSSAKAMASARRLLKLDLVDAVLVGGVDTLGGLTLAGFDALELVSRSRRCNPFSKNRDGLVIGEAAVFFLMTREEGPLQLLGIGSSSDAHHMSAPHPEAAGAIVAMQAALADAGLASGEVDYVNLHGTATPHNDAMEARAMVGVFGAAMPIASSTKPMLGHALGAAGALEAAVSALALSEFNTEGALPPHVWDGEADPALPVMRWARGNEGARPRVVMSNSFGFGGTNVSLILGRAS